VSEALLLLPDQRHVDELGEGDLTLPIAARLQAVEKPLQSKEEGHFFLVFFIYSIF
jgi:hypothetical protein